MKYVARPSLVTMGCWSLVGCSSRAQLSSAPNPKKRKQLRQKKLETRRRPPLTGRSSDCWKASRLIQCRLGEKRNERARRRKSRVASSVKAAVMMSLPTLACWSRSELESDDVRCGSLSDFRVQPAAQSATFIFLISYRGTPFTVSTTTLRYGAMFTGVRTSWFSLKPVDSSSSTSSCAPPTTRHVLQHNTASYLLAECSNLPLLQQLRLPASTPDSHIVRAHPALGVVKSVLTLELDDPLFHVGKHHFLSAVSRASYS